MKVVCLNWNNYLGRGAEYVGKLENMVRRNLTLPYEFVCLTEDDLPEGKRGWWNKLTLLEMFDGEVLYLDLDLVIGANIDHLVRLARTDPTRIWMRDDFSYSIVNPRADLDAYTRRQLGGPGCCNSSVMMWSGKRDMSGAAGMVADMHGDQNVISAMFWPDGIGLWPKESVKSYKYHVLRGLGWGDITVMHGEPKNHQIRDPELLKCWV